jgi:hypothetical protein
LVDAQLAHLYKAVRDAKADAERFERAAFNSPAGAPMIQEVEHRATERRFWDRQIRVAKCLNWITFLSALVALFGLGFVYLGLIETKRAGDIARETLIASNRAWLAPVDAIIDGQIQKDQPINTAIVFENTGKGPALDVYNVAVGGFTLPVSDQEAAQQQKTGPFGGSAVHTRRIWCRDRWQPTHDCR